MASPAIHLGAPWMCAVWGRGTAQCSQGQAWSAGCAGAERGLSVILDLGQDRDQGSSWSAGP